MAADDDAVVVSEEDEPTPPAPQPEGWLTWLAKPVSWIWADGSGDQRKPPPLEKEEFGVTEALIEFVQELCNDPKAFTHFPLSEEAAKLFEMDHFLVGHMNLMLRQAPRLAELRYVMVPKYMTEERFWNVYYFLVSDRFGLLRPEEEVPHPVKENAWKYTMPPVAHDPSVLLSDQQWETLVRWLPLRYFDTHFTLLFRASHDGYSLATMQEKAGTMAPLVIIIRSRTKHTFGAFVTESIAPTPAPAYHGTGESFLYTISPEVEKYSWKELATTASNILVSTTEFLALGGGRGYGLWLDNLLAHGTSVACETFSNPVLGGGTEEHGFDVQDVEVFGVS